MSDEKDISIRIRQSGKKASGNIFTDLFSERTFSQDPECIFRKESASERHLKKNLIIGPAENEDEHDESESEEEDEERLTYSTTLKPLMIDATGALERRRTRHTPLREE